MFVAITGASSGLGSAIASVIMGRSNAILYNISKERGDRPISTNERFVPCDLNHPDEIWAACEVIKKFGALDILINCAGVNEINYLEDLELEDWDHVLSVNTRALYLMSQGLLPLLKESKGTILNIVSNASHMPMTASLAYNASKGAAHIMTLQLARELTKKYGITVFGISPNKLSGTAMSNYIDRRVTEVRGWSAEQAAEYQRASLLTAEETDPEVLAEFIGYLLYHKRNHKYLSGCVIPYGA